MTLTLTALAAVVIAALGGGQADPETPPAGTAAVRSYRAGCRVVVLRVRRRRVRRIATLGEEVRDAQRTIPIAIPLALGIVVAIYALVAVSALLAVGPDQLAATSAPATAAAAGHLGWLAAAVRIGGAVASLGVLAALLARIGQTTLAMARDQKLPGWLAAIQSRTGPRSCWG